jgi:hypothetical protein
MESAFIRCRKKDADKTEEDESNEDTHRHSGNTSSKKVSRSRGHAKPAVLKHHPVRNTKPDIDVEVDVVDVCLYIGQADENESPCDNECP